MGADWQTPSTTPAVTIHHTQVSMVVVLGVGFFIIIELYADFNTVTLVSYLFTSNADLLISVS